MPRICDEVKFGEDQPLDNAPELTEEEKFSIKKRMEAMDKLLSDAGKAKYKLELYFGGVRSMSKPTKGILSFWESGTKFHGGGDEKVYLCPGKRKGKNECESVIPARFNGYGHLVCDNCGLVWPGDQVIGEHIGNHTMRGWSLILASYFHKMQCNCDIYLKHSPDDIRSTTAAELEYRKHGDLMKRLRGRRALHVYPLKNILKDTSSGSDVPTRFFAFLTA